MEQIDLLDRKILYELGHNSKQSASKIARKCRVHRNVVNFRINKLLEKGIIKQFVAIISPSALGLTPYKFYLQLQNFTEEKEKQIIELIKTMPVYWAAKVSGRWDFIIGLLVKNSQELNELKLKILSELGNDITNKSLSMLVEAAYFYREYFLDEKEFSPIRYWIRKAENNKIDKKDIEILKILANNSRKSVLDISKKLNISVKTVMTRIKNLEKKEIIADYMISLNLENIGYKFFKCFISLKKANKLDIKRFTEYCRTNKSIIHLVECVGDWDLEPEFEVKSYEAFYKIVSDIREKFGGIIKNIETIDIIKEYSYVCLPE